MPAVLTVNPATTAVSIEFNLGDTFTLTFPIFDSTGAAVNATGFAAKALVSAPGTGVPYAGAVWSTSAGTATCGPGGVVLSFNGTLTAGWTWTAGQFALAVTNVSGQSSLLAAGPILALPVQVPAPIQ